MSGQGFSPEYSHPEFNSDFDLDLDDPKATARKGAEALKRNIDLLVDKGFDPHKILDDRNPYSPTNTDRPNLLLPESYLNSVRGETIPIVEESAVRASTEEEILEAVKELCPKIENAIKSAKPGDIIAFDAVSLPYLMAIEKVTTSLKTYLSMHQISIRISERMRVACIQFKHSAKRAS